ncbi:MAG: PAS domain S-box protein [Flavobacterium sp.]|nr:PAS domain S-box protein [Flavobacterium sp.]
MIPIEIFKKLLHTFLPTHLLIDDKMNLISVGNLIQSNFGVIINTNFASSFFIPNHTSKLSYNYLQSCDNKTFIVCATASPQEALICKLCLLENSNHLLINIINKDTSINHQYSIAENTHLDFSKLNSKVEEIGYQLYLYNLDDSSDFTELIYTNANYNEFYDLDANNNKSVISEVKYWSASIHPEDIWMIQDAERAYRSGKIRNHALHYRKFDANGNIRWILDKGIGFEYKDGKLKKIICIQSDITELNASKQELYKQKMFFENILNSLPADIAVFDKSHNYVFVNTSAIKSYEIRNWIIGKKDEDYVNLKKLPNSLFEDRRKAFNEVKNTLTPKSFEQEIIKPDGSKAYFLRIFHPYINNGDLEFVIGYGINISERKQIEQEILKSETKYKTLIDKSLAIITTHTLEGVFTMVNPMVTKVFGFEAHEVVGHNISEFISQEDLQHYKKIYVDELKNKKQHNGIVKVLNAKKEIIYILYKNYLIEEGGFEPYVISYSVDITKRIEAENKLKKAKKELHQTNISKERFLANISHELRTPMNGIIGLINLLEKTILNNNQKEYLELIKGSSESLLLLLNELLDFEKIAAGKLQLEKIHFDVSETITKIVESSRYKIDGKRLPIEINNRLPKNQFVIGDPHKLGQIILNLISNAIKFTSDRGTILVDMNLIDNNEKSISIEVSVTDSGIGISKDKIDKIFEPFVQAENNISRKFGGTGLGLSISKYLIELQGGTIKVESILGKGSIFSFNLTYPKVSKKKEIRTAIQENTTSKNILIGTKILIADDDEVSQYVLKKLIEQWGCVVAIVKNGKEAVEALKRDNFDMIFMDIQMPEMDGFEATKAIRTLRNKKKADIPIIAVTSNALKDILLKYIRSGVNEYILKPYNETTVLETIIKFLDVSQIESQLIARNGFNNNDAEQFLLNNNHNLVLEIAKVFNKTSLSSYNLMVESYKKGDWDTMAKISHKLNFGINFLFTKDDANVFNQLQNNISKKTKNSEMEELLFKLGESLLLKYHFN